MKQWFVITAQLPSLNTVINANRANRYGGNQLKRDVEEAIGWAIKQAQTKGDLTRWNEPCEIYIEWHEKTKRRDVDNVQSSQKFILDALVKNGVLQNDGQKWVKQIYHDVIPSDRDFVKVCIYEAGSLEVTEIERDLQESDRNIR